MDHVQTRESRRITRRSAFVDGSSKLRLTWLAGAVLVLGSLAIFWHATQFEFQPIDDELNFVYNPHVGSLSPMRIHWAFADTAYQRRYMPLGYISFDTIFTFAGLDSHDWHAIGVAMHLADAVLIFALILRLTASVGEEVNRATWRVLCAAMGAAFWAWHPLRAESVGWASGILYEQANGFALLSLILFIGSPRPNPEPSCRPAWRGLAALACYAMSLLTYPVAMGLAPAYLVLAWRDRPALRQAILRSAPYFAAAAAAFAIAMFARVHAGTEWNRVPTWTEFTPFARFMQACYLWTYYGWRPFWPVGLQHLDPVLINFDPWAPRFVASALVLIAVVATCVGWRRTRRAFGAYVFLHLCILFPMLGLTEHPHFPSDRYAALPQVIWIVALVSLATRVNPKLARVVVAGGGILASLVLAAASRRQLEIWRTPATLMAHVESHIDPATWPYMAYQRPAILRYVVGDYAGAMRILDEWQHRAPNDAMAKQVREEISAAWAEHGRRLSQAGAPASTPPIAFSEQNLGIEAARAGDFWAATVHLLRAHNDAPGFHEPDVNLAIVSLQRGDPETALRYYLCAEATGNEHFSVALRMRILDGLATQFARRGESRLANAARRKIAQLAKGT